MFANSYMVTSLKKDTEDTDTGQKDSGFWIVCGKLKRRSKRQVWRDRLAKLELEDFHRVATLGIGGFGKVDLVTSESQADCKSFALKTIPKTVLKDKEHRRHSITEKDIHITLDSKFIIQLYRTFQDSAHLHMLMEICLGGDLWSLLRDHKYFPDNTARFYIGCVVEALDYLHHLGITYRDVKPENCLISDKGYLKLADMGLAKKIKVSTKTFSFCGTAEYVPPEVVLKTGHGPSVDFWALGILVYELVEGRPPLQARNQKQTYQLILKGIDGAHFPDYVSSSAQDIVRALCRNKPRDRLGYGLGGFENIRRHKWYNGFNWKELQSQTLQPPIIPSISNHLDTSCFDNFSTSIPSPLSSGYDSEVDDTVQHSDQGGTNTNVEFEYLKGWNF